ncbi:MAG: S4 domain-containing protein, partial [Ruminococcus sp.]|nr:S4 domain-containing protein [Ruminococcus sp.]
MERLDKYLASRGTGSRREVQQLIKSGAVTVDGAVCKKPETKLSDAAEVLVRGQAVGERFVYLMLNKP